MEDIKMDDRIFADLHIHGPFSVGASKKITIENILLYSTKIGLKIVGTGDILQLNWLRYLKDKLIKNRKNEFKYSADKNISFILSGEIEDKEGIHLLFFLPDFETAADLRKRIITKTSHKNLNMGRPIVKLEGIEIVELVHDLNGLVGPAHSFTPFKSIFRENRYERIENFYKHSKEKFDFIELGLSANSNLADKIKSLWTYPFLSNSDCHSLLPGKLGREFNILKLENSSFENIRQALKGTKDNAIIANAGLDPRLGKYYRSFCYNCRRRVFYGEKEACRETSLIIKSQYLKETLELIKKKRMRCKCCGGLIKLGVLDRINYMATTEEKNSRRPPYYNIVPLIEIIRISLNLKHQYTKKTINYYDFLVKKIGSEINILLIEDLSKIEKIDKTIANTLKLVRENKLPIIEGGGGRYGFLDKNKILYKKA